MSLLKVKGNPSGGGLVTLQSPASTVDRTLTLPDDDGVLVRQGDSLVNVSASRALGTTYTNNTSRWRKVYARVQGASGGQSAIGGTVNGQQIFVATTSENTSAAWQVTQATVILDVPPGASYSVQSAAVGATLITWFEFQ